MQKKLPSTIAAGHTSLWPIFFDFLNSPDVERSLKVSGRSWYFAVILVFLSFSAQAQLAVENFEGGIPSSWTLFGNGTGTGIWAISPDGYLGSDAAFINPGSENIGQGNTAQYFMVTPSLEVPENAEIRFYSKRSSELANENITYQLRVSTASQPDINGFSVVLASWSGSDLNVGPEDEYEEKIIAIPSSIPANLDIYVAFVAVNNQTGTVASGDAWYVDNVRIGEACLKVETSTITATSITPTTANISWTHPEITNFQIQLVLQNELPGANGSAINGNTFAANNLEPDTFYDVYIKTICDSETASGWAGPFSFKTKMLGLSCDAPIIIPNNSSTPYILSSNLDLYNNPDITYPNQGSSCVSPALTENFLAGSKIFLTYTPTGNGLLNIKQFTLPYSQGSGCFGNAITGVFVYEDCSDVGVNCMAGLNTSNTDEPKYISNLYVEAGHTYTIVISSSFEATTSICFTFELSFSTCAPPNSYTYKNLLQNSVSFSWNNAANLASSWEYVVQPAGTGVPTGPGTVTNTNVDNVINSGLTAGTPYELYVRSVCNATPGGWGMPYAFTTQCAPFATPYYTGFLDTSEDNPEACWTSIDVNNDGLTWSYLAGWDVPNYATLQTYTNQNNNSDILSSVQVIFDGSAKRLRYKHQVVGGAASYAIKISTTGIGVENFTYELLPETQITNESWEEVIYNIPLTITGNVNIAWVVSPVGSGETATRISLTDVYIEDKPACPDPLLPTVGEVTATTAMLSWTTGDAEEQWEVLILPHDADEPTAEADGVVVPANTYLAEDLDPAMRYKYYVRAYCNETQQSQWIGPVDFITDCVTFETPFYESFNDEDADTHKFCWSLLDENADNTTWNMDVESAMIQGSNSWFNPTTGYDDWLISPAINAIGIKELKFKYRARFSFFAPVSRYGVQVLISYTDNNPASFVELSPLEDFTNIDYIEKSLYFTGTGVVYIAFRVPPDFVIEPGTSTMDIEDVAIIDAVPCPTPDVLSAQDILSNSATVTWNEVYQETGYQVVVQESGTGIPTGNGVSVPENSYTAETLSPATDYEFYVRSTCSDGSLGDWAGPFVFTTLCAPLSTPFLETFETTSASESCWRVLNVNNDGFIFNLDVISDPYEGAESAGMFTGSNGANNDWLVSPTINVTANQRLRFRYKVFDSFFTEDLQVKLSTTGIEPTAFTTTLYDTATDPNPLNNMEYKEMVINIPAGTTGAINFAWHIPNMPPNDWGYRGQLLFIDNVIVEDIPPCPQPYNISLANITDTTVDVNWETAGTETQWEVAVLPYGTPTPVGGQDPAVTFIAGEHPFTVTGLDAAQHYDIYVRAVCGSTIDWIGPIEVTTKCSFENLCEYTVILSGAGSWGVGGGIDVIQNEQVVQTLEWPTGAWNEEVPPAEFPVFLCTGVEFSLFWDALGTAPGQYPEALVELKDASGTIIWTSETGLGTPRRTLYTGISICGDVTCPQPTDLAVSDVNEFTWTAGGTETSWEVFVQPFENGTLPLDGAGTTVTSPSYTPVEADFTDGNAGTYEYFVRAICSGTDASYWSGPFVFVRNNDQTTSIALPINPAQECVDVAKKASFNGATASAEAMTCQGLNNGDIWYGFEATAKNYLIELTNFSGVYYYEAGNLPYSDVTLTLYNVATDGELEEIACSYNNALLTMYSSELVIGNSYKLKITQNAETAMPYTFDVCVKTVVDPCEFVTINGNLEEPIAEIGAITNMYTQKIVPGWRYNLMGYWSTGVFFFFDALNTVNVVPYEGGQFLQLMASDTGLEPDLDNIDGMYQDFDSSEITKYDFEFAHATRGGLVTLDLYAGPPQGPFTLVHEATTQNLSWELNEGSYAVPGGQDVTRFVFRSRNDAIGNLIDAIKFTPNNKILTEDISLACNENDPVIVMAEGKGTWIANEANPTSTIIAEASNKNTTISGFTISGVYSYTWKTRYCEDVLQITYSTFSDVPTVETPVAYCLNAIAQPLSATASGSNTLVWFTEAVGGTGTAAAPTPSTATVGNTSYYVSEVNPSGCEGPRVEIVVTVNALAAPQVGFTFNSATYCILGADPVLIPSEGFATGGTYSATPSGLTMNTATGQVDLSASAAGTYTITYDMPANGCFSTGSHAETITVNGATAVAMDFTYAEACTNVSSILPQPGTGFITGGIFSATELTIDPATGAVTTGGMAEGEYEVVYTLAPNAEACTEGGTYTATVVLLGSIPAVTTFTYNEEYCQGSAAASPVLATGFTTGGIFDSGDGLAIDTVSGTIDFANSAPGNYTITYTVDADESLCISGNSSSDTIAVAANTAPIITQECDGTSLLLKASGVPASAAYVWQDAAGNTISTSEALDINNYLSQNPNVSLPVQIALNVENGGCVGNAAYTVTSIPCMDVPKGVSPNGDGKNDTFDLSGMNVRSITIFNRYGTEVYSHDGQYTDQWHGQTNDGNDLPVATYFYALTKSDGTSITGWVYISRK